MTPSITHRRIRNAIGTLLLAAPLLSGLACKTREVQSSPTEPPRATEPAETASPAREEAEGTRDEAPVTASVREEGPRPAESAGASAETSKPTPPPDPATPPESPPASTAAFPPEPDLPPGEEDRITIRTGRSSKGLPENVDGYQAWFRLPPSTTSPPEPHLLHRQAYILFPEQENYTTGSTVAPPLDRGTIILLEQKPPRKSFISRIDVMTRDEAGWKFLAYERASTQQAFAPAAMKEADCAACHAKSAEKDSVFSSLKLE